MAQTTCLLLVACFALAPVSPDPGADAPRFGPSPEGPTFLLSSDTLAPLGHTHGVHDAKRAPVRRSFLRGLGWSAVAGPLGGVFAAWRSGAAARPIPEHRSADFQELGESYEGGYYRGFDMGFAPRRTEASIVGSMVGSLVWTFVLIQAVDLPGGMEVEGSGPTGPPTFSVSVPLRLDVR